jgi:hypothetical protein
MIDSVDDYADEIHNAKTKKSPTGRIQKMLTVD